MLQYETAILLKQTGFPQRKGGRNPEEHLKYGSPVWMCAHHNTCSDAYECPTSVYLPCLEHLIDECLKIRPGFDLTVSRNSNPREEAAQFYLFIAQQK